MNAQIRSTQLPSNTPFSALGGERGVQDACTSPQQTVMDFAAARAAADRGMRLAVEHAERLDDTFPARAEAFIYEYARTHYEFTSEQATAAAERSGVKPLSDGRAWGAPIKRAASAGVMEATDRTAPRLKGHGSPGVVYRSLVFGGGV